jgi:tetratricopeptide (TPR) repeat protein
MRRLVLVLLAPLFLFGPASALDERDCDYWRLGKNDAEKASRFEACNRIIGNKFLDAAVRARAYAERANWAESNHGAKSVAIADYDKALELAPGNAQWLRSRAYLLYFNKEYDRAIRDFNDLLAAKPDAHVNLLPGTRVA